MEIACKYVLYYFNVTHFNFDYLFLFFQVPLLLPGIAYTYETFVECITENAISDKIKVFIYCTISFCIKIECLIFYKTFVSKVFSGPNVVKCVICKFLLVSIFFLFKKFQILNYSKALKVNS